MIGWRSLRDESKADLSSTDLFHHDSRRFEVATSCVPLMAGLRSSLQLLDQTGSAQQRWERIRTLSGKLWQALQGLEARHTPAGSAARQRTGELSRSRAM